jgi:hypothetical protein
MDSVNVEVAVVLGVAVTAGDADMVLVLSVTK